MFGILSWSVFFTVVSVVVGAHKLSELAQQRLPKKILLKHVGLVTTGWSGSSKLEGRRLVPDGSSGVWGTTTGGKRYVVKLWRASRRCGSR